MKRKRPEGFSHANRLEPLYMVIINLMRRHGRDFAWCEVGSHKNDGPFELHHTKYEGATFYDLLISCRKCNRAKENTLLD